jgi:hypothetical protein
MASVSCDGGSIDFPWSCHTRFSSMDTDINILTHILCTHISKTTGIIILLDAQQTTKGEPKGVCNEPLKLHIDIPLPWGHFVLRQNQLTLLKTHHIGSCNRGSEPLCVCELLGLSSLQLVSHYHPLFGESRPWAHFLFSGKQKLGSKLERIVHIV